MNDENDESKENARTTTFDEEVNELANLWGESISQGLQRAGVFPRDAAERRARTLAASFSVAPVGPFDAPTEETLVELIAIFRQVVIGTVRRWVTLKMGLAAVNRMVDIFSFGPHLAAWLDDMPFGLLELGYRAAEEVDHAR